MTTDSTPIDEEARIREVLEDRAAALRAKDAGRFLAHYGPEVVKFDLAPPLLFEGPGIREPAGLEAWYSTWQGPIGYEITRLRIEVGDALAFGHWLTRMTGTKTDGVTVDLWSRSTVGLRRLHGTWKITHEHHSTPFYMDGSGRAALDLLP